jgi:hypothetical protein
MIEGGGNRVAIKLARFLHRRFPKLEAAIGAGRGTSRGKQERAGKLLVVTRLNFGADGIFGNQRLEIIQAARQSFDFRRLIDVERVLIVIDTGEPSAVFQEPCLGELLEERTDAGRDHGVEDHVYLVGDDAVRADSIPRR